MRRIKFLYWKNIDNEIIKKENSLFNFLRVCCKIVTTSKKLVSSEFFNKETYMFTHSYNPKFKDTYCKHQSLGIIFWVLKAKFVINNMILNHIIYYFKTPYSIEKYLNY